MSFEVRSAISERAVENLCNYAALSPPGCFVELGVYRGGSAIKLAEVARAQGRELYLFDTFQGIPFSDPIDAHKVGDFGDTDIDAVKRAIPDAVLVQGVFPESLIKMPPIAFVHVDADQYRSVKAACEIFPPQMVHGGVMLFDDYGCLEGATKAVHEHFSNIERTAHGKAVVRIYGLAS